MYIYNFACLGDYLLVCLLYPINVKTMKPIGPKFCVRPHLTPEKIYGPSKLNLIFISLQPDSVNLWYFKLCILLDHSSLKYQGVTLY